MEVLPNIAILNFEGLLADVKISGVHSCMIVSPKPLTEAMMDILQVDILSALMKGTPEEIAERKKQPFKLIRELLKNDGIEVVDVANIDIERSGKSIWTQTAGHRYHANKLERLVFEE